MGFQHGSRIRRLLVALVVGGALLAGAWTGESQASVGEVGLLLSPSQDLLEAYQAGIDSALQAEAPPDTVIEPPSPEPPPSGDTARGDKITSGFWAGWTVRDDTKHVTCTDHGCMKSNTQGCRYLGNDDDGEGRIRFKVKLTHSSQINLAGGKHLAGFANYGVALEPDHDWVTGHSLRIDLDRPSDGKIRVHVYNYGSQGLTEPLWWPNVAGLALNQWTTIDVRWEKLGDQLKMTLNGQTHYFDLQPGTPNPGRYFYTGNMDSITGSVEFDDLYWEQ